jgi:hypothetical protein
LGAVDRILRNLRFDLSQRKVLLVFDEAQHLSIECLETLRELLDQPPHCTGRMTVISPRQPCHSRRNSSPVPWKRPRTTTRKLPMSSGAGSELRPCCYFCGGPGCAWQGSMRFLYGHRSHCSDEWSSREFVIRLAWTPCNFGGLALASRHWGSSPQALVYLPRSGLWASCSSPVRRSRHLCVSPVLSARL